MKFAHDVIRKPVITERSMSGLAENKYVFEVAPGAGVLHRKRTPGVRLWGKHPDKKAYDLRS